MKFSTHAWHAGSILALGVSFFLNSCEEKEPAAPAETPAAEAPAPAPASEPAPAPEPEVDMLAETREALFNYAVYTLGAKVTSPETFPELNSMVKDMLEKMQAYYAELQKGEPGEERARMALQIATTTRDLGAYSKAQGEYENALREVESLPEELRSTPACQRLLSSCKNGIGVCLLAQNKANDALAQYEAALAVDEALFNQVGPREGEELPAGEVAPDISRAAADLFDSYRCLGDCQRAVDDPEEARTTYMKGQELAQRLKRLSPDMSLSYVKLLTSLGNLDNALGKSQEALQSWVLAAKICQGLNGSSPRLDVKAETKRCFDALLPAIQSVGQKLQAEQAESAAKAAEEKAAAEKAAAEQAAAEKAAAERLAAEQAAQQAQATAEQVAQAPAEGEPAANAGQQEETNKRVRRRRRRRH